MAYFFTINRKLEDTDDYGCTCFSTNQLTGQVASSGGLLDGDIIWYLDANPGYTVSVSDFSIPNATPTNVPQLIGYKTFEGAGVPSPILGVVFEQDTSTRIIIRIFLYPNSTHGITGNAFVMPDNNVTASLDIDGCAFPAGDEHSITVVHNISGDQKDLCNVNCVIENDFAGILTKQTINHETTVSGILDDSHNDAKLFNYILTAPAGQKFRVEPTIVLDTNKYYYTSTFNSEMTEATFCVYKGTQQQVSTGVGSTPVKQLPTALPARTSVASVSRTSSY